MPININELNNNDIVGFLRQTLASGSFKTCDVKKELLARVQELANKIPSIPKLEEQIIKGTQKLSLCHESLQKFELGKKPTPLELQYKTILQEDATTLERELKQSQDDLRALSELNLILKTKTSRK